jgi:N-acetylglucosaminyldiphosphoundecaprenol N-acetyl-beta-D-mannosaminyltransferase
VVLAANAILDYQDVQKPRRTWRFYISDVETLVCHLRGLRFGTAPGAVIAVCNVHMFISARHDEALATALSTASFAVCDGQPIAWLAGMFTAQPVARITGPEILRHVLLEGALAPKIALVGGSPSALRKIKQLLHGAGRAALVIDPGKVPPSGQPDQRTLATLMQFAPDLVFVALGCPKQEKWAAAAAKVVPSTFIGVGAAFDYLAGELHRAPLLMQRTGMEWLYRLVQQPRLFRRYVITHGPFLALLAKTMIREKRRRWLLRATGE